MNIAQIILTAFLNTITFSILLLVSSISSVALFAEDVSGNGLQILGVIFGFPVIFVISLALTAIVFKVTGENKFVKATFIITSLIALVLGLIGGILY